MALLDPELDVLLAKKARLEAHPSEGSFSEPADKQYFISLKFTGDVESLEQAGLTVGSTVGDVAYRSTDIAGFEALSKPSQVEMIVKMRSKRPQLDESVPDLKANEVWTRSGDNFTGYNGRCVIVGIIDTRTAQGGETPGYNHTSHDRTYSDTARIRRESAQAGRSSSPGPRPLLGD